MLRRINNFETNKPMVWFHVIRKVSLDFSWHFVLVRSPLFPHPSKDTKNVTFCFISKVLIHFVKVPVLTSTKQFPKKEHYLLTKSTTTSPKQKKWLCSNYFFLVSMSIFPSPPNIKKDSACLVCLQNETLQVLMKFRQRTRIKEI